MLTLAAKAMKNNHSFSFSNYQMLSEINKENVISFNMRRIHIFPFTCMEPSKKLILEYIYFVNEVRFFTLK